jgi:hypothetical protein
MKTTLYTVAVVAFMTVMFLPALFCIVREEVKHKRGLK